MRSYDITRVRWIRALLISRWPQVAIASVTLAGFTVAILAGLVGTPVGSRNFSIVFVWIAWWAALILVAVPLLGRSWCSACPIPLVGDWLQRGAVLGPRKGGWSLSRRWPRRWRNIWLQNAAFVLLALFSTVILTSPVITAGVLFGLLVLAVVTSLIFERRSFCRFLCPVSGFIGSYSQVAPIELRTKDGSRCAVCREKSCYRGNASGYGCPWLIFPRTLSSNAPCGLCLECLRTCPHDNIAVRLRPVGTDLTVSTYGGVDEAFKSLILLGSALVYSVVLLSPWGALKTASYNVGSAAWLVYVVAFLTFVAVLLPGTFFLAVALGHRLARSTTTVRTSFIRFSRTLIPLGLGAWIAFTLSFVLANVSYVWPVLSDPMGWGWNLAGTGHLEWTPYLTGLLPLMQAAVLVGAACWSSATARHLAGREGRRAHLQVLPVAFFSLAVTVTLLWLLAA